MIGKFCTHPLHKDVAYKILGSYSVEKDKVYVRYEPLIRRADAPYYADEVKHYRAFGKELTGIWNKSEYERLIELGKGLRS